jgi:hypothetical protein
LKSRLLDCIEKRGEIDLLYKEAQSHRVTKWQSDCALFNFVTLWLCYFVTLSLCHFVTLSKSFNDHLPDQGFIPCSDPHKINPWG